MSVRQTIKGVRDRLPVFRELVAIRGELIDLRGELRAALGALRDMSAHRTHDAAQLAAHAADPRRLEGYPGQVNSQNAEDGMIAELFRRIGTTNQTFLEIGVGDGSENNTAFLLAQGWRGFWIDGDDAFVNLVKTRGLNREPAQLKYLVDFVTRENITERLTTLGVPAEIDLLSLDVDQNTYWIWEGMRGFRPRVMVVEYNATIPPNVSWKVQYDGKRTWDQTANFGASLKAFEELGAERGYSLVGCDWMGCNAFFVRNDLIGDHFAAPFTAEHHYQPPRYPAFTLRRGHRAGLLDVTPPKP